MGISVVKFTSSKTTSPTWGVLKDNKVFLKMNAVYTLSEIK